VRCTSSSGGVEHVAISIGMGDDGHGTPRHGNRAGVHVEFVITLSIELRDKDYELVSG
jgi:hypothetical protein